MKTSLPIQYEIAMPDNSETIECAWAIYTLEQYSPEKLTPDAQSKILAIADKIIASRLKVGASILRPTDAKEVLKVLLQSRRDEVMAVLLLNSKHEIIKFEELFPWTIDSAMVYTRTLIRHALDHNAAACVLVHNHPSWIPDPSRADITITERVKDALEFINVRLLDHFIVGTQWVRSLAEEGVI